MVEGASLESWYTGNCIEGSNPFLSAFFKGNLLNNSKLPFLFSKYFQPFSNIQLSDPNELLLLIYEFI